MVSDDGHTKEADLSARELTAQLAGQLSRLVSEELALAKAEMFASARQAVLGSGLLAGAAVAGLTVWLAMAAALTAGIALAIPVWAALLSTSAIYTTVGGALALLGRRHLKTGAPLRMTAESVRKEFTELAASGSAAANGREHR